MTNYFIGEPTEFCHMEGKAIDFRKTFDLNGKDNDEMLRLYLSLSGLSDNIERLSQDQRRSYIYDIIQSNKLPGYWMPSTMMNNTPPNVRPPPISPSGSPFSERHRNALSKGNSPQPSTGSMSITSSTASLQSFTGNNSYRFVPAPDTPPSPSSIVTHSKGRKYEISGPINFQHLTGDMARDRTRNAFDLGANPNDNVLKKYMIERGIRDDDLSGMHKHEIIKNIVHSNFTWMPPKSKAEQPKLLYATISTNNGQTTPPSPPNPNPSQNHTKFSNYATITSRFIDLSELSIKDVLSDSNSDSNQQYNSKKAPPKRISKPLVPPPPPPSCVMITAKNAAPTKLQELPDQPRANMISKVNPENLYAQIKPKQKTNNPQIYKPPPPPPVKPHSVASIKHISSSQTQQHKVQPTILANNIQTSILPTPPPPPPPPSSSVIKPTAQLTANASGTKFSPVPPPLSPAMAPPPPPPPPLMIPMITSTKKDNVAINETIRSSLNDDEPDRDALLKSIRLGVTLKKVERKSATISGIKARTELKPPIHDFLSELRMGIILRRVKNPKDNSFSDFDADESHA